jgi:hypothetical protein
MVMKDTTLNTFHKPAAKFIAMIFLALASGSSYAQDIGSQTSTSLIDVSTVQFGSGVFYIRTQSQGLGPTGCPNPDYIFVRQTEPDYKMITSLILIAKATNKKMSFSGYCQTDGTYFRITYAIAY